MTKQAIDSTIEIYEEREKARRREFLERMEQKLQFKVQAYREQRVRQVS
jgi:hypothetical protein